jgi:Flp pilus assembly CpaF family ATPase
MAEDRRVLVQPEVHSWRDAIMAAMRFRPDRILVGEVRDGSALELLKAWNTGPDGHSMIERYRRKARTWNLGQLGPLHALIPELAEAEPTVRIRPGIPP